MALPSHFEDIPIANNFNAENVIEFYEIEETQPTPVTYVEKEMKQEEPESLDDLVGPGTLDLSNTELDDFNFQIIPETLIELNISNNKIPAIQFCQFNQSLKYLNVSNNKISVIENINYLLNLTNLNLSNNELITLPDEFSQLIKLKELNLESNRCRMIPDSIFELFNLEYLNISKNKILSIPVQLTKLKKLNCLIIEGNPLKEACPFELRKFIPTRERFQIIAPLESSPKALQPITTINSPRAEDESRNWVKLSNRLHESFPGTSILGLQRSNNLTNSHPIPLEEAQNLIPNAQTPPIDKNQHALSSLTTESNVKNPLPTGVEQRPISHQDTKKKKEATKKYQSVRKFSEDIGSLFPPSPKYFESSQKFNRVTSVIVEKMKFPNLSAEENQIRANALFRAVRIRVDCREYLEQLQSNKLWLILPPNSLLIHFEFTLKFIEAHLITIQSLLFNNPSEKIPFVTHSGLRGSLNFQENLLEISKLKSSAPMSQAVPKETFDILNFGKLEVENATFYIILLNDSILDIRQSLYQKKSSRTLKSYLLSLQNRKKFESSLGKFIRTFRKEFETKAYNEMVSIFHTKVEDTKSALLQTPFFSHPPPSKMEIQDLHSEIRLFLMQSLYDLLFTQNENKDEDYRFYTRVKQLNWITHEHLDIKIDLYSLPDFIEASQKLIVMNNSICPHDKLRNMLECCKVLYNLLTNFIGNGELGADQFLPALIYLILKANPPHLPSNLFYIEKFCSSKSELCGEASYYFTNVQSCINFLFNLKPHDLVMPPEEFARRMTSNSNSLSLKSISFLNYSVDHLKISDIENLLDEYQALAHWYIINTDAKSKNKIPIRVPETLQLGLCKVKQKISDFYSLVTIPKNFTSLTWASLRDLICAKFGKEREALKSIIWLPDTLISDNADCVLLWNKLVDSHNIELQVIFE